MIKKTFLVLGLILCTVFLSGCSLKKQPLPTETPPAESSEAPAKPIEESIKERPFVSLLPTTDGHWVTLEVKNIPKGVSGLEYELTYMADVEGNKIERGVSTGGKPADLNGANNFSKKILFGSASCTTGTCKYRYDENVTEGKLSLKLSGFSETYETVFRIQKGSEGKEGFTTGDGIFTFTSLNLPKNNLYLTISSVGIILPLPTGVIAKSVPYEIFPTPVGKGTVSFKTTVQDAKIYLYSGSSWQALATSVSGDLLTAEAPKSGIFILGK